jgi:hypothetical protein
MRAKKRLVNPGLAHAFAPKGGPAALDQQSLLVPSHARPHDLRALLTEVKSARHVTFSLKKPLPTDLLDGLTQVAEKRSASLEAIVEELDAKHLHRLHSAGLTVFYGVGLPAKSIIVLDGKRGFAIDETQESAGPKFTRIQNADDLYVALVWHKFGIAAHLSGSVTAVDVEHKLFRMTINGSRDQWCRFRDSDANDLPQVGINVEIFGWEKWNTHIIVVLELKELESEMGLRD